MVLGIRLDFIVVCFFLSENLINSLECAVNLLLAPHGALSTGMFHVFWITLSSLIYCGCEVAGTAAIGEHTFYDFRSGRFSTIPWF